MKELREAIQTWGKAAGTDIVKVDMFLNHRIDTNLLFRMGEEIAAYFSSKQPTLILTVEASGIALAVAAAYALHNIPVVFAKKAPTAVQNGEVIQASVYSFTHKQTNMIRVEKKYLPSQSRVLIIDDFLADGQAVHGLMSLCEQTGCFLCGVGIGIEKGFQNGGKTLRDEGIDLLSLAVVEKIENEKIILLDD